MPDFQSRLPTLREKDMLIITKWLRFLYEPSNTNPLKLLCLSLLFVLPSTSCLSTTPPEVAAGEPEPNPTVTPSPLATFPQELATSFDREQCPDYCWHGIMLGQTQEEALAAIRSDPWTDTTFKFQPNDEYIRIQELEDRTGISWQVKNLPHLRRPAGFVEIRDGIVNALLFPLTETFPFQILLDELGEPAYVFADGIAAVESGETTFYIVYPEKGFNFAVHSVDFPPILATESIVETVLFYNEATDYRCHPAYFPWDGLGGPNKYYGWPASSFPFDKTLPPDCEGN